MAETNKRSHAVLRPPVCSAGVSASMLVSVAPLVKVTFLASQPTRLATCARAFSTKARAARPSACTEEAVAVTSSAVTIAARASSRKGALAFQSK